MSNRKPPLLIGENHPKWKGDKVGYSALHDYISYYKGQPKFCEGCGTETAGRYEWANISGEYRRDLDDYLRLCKKCHFKYDKRKFGGKIERPKGWIDPKKQMNFKTCPVCKKEFRVPKSLMRLVCCSKECGTINRKGKAPQIDNRGRKPWNAGKTNIYSEETKKAMGAKNVGISRSFETQFGQPKGWKRS